MKDVSHKFDTLREALAEAFLACDAEALLRLKEGRCDKGDALNFARAAGILAAKRTSDLIPLCHPLPIWHSDVTYTFEAEGVRISASAKTIAPTGVEMEALTAASVAALTIYDMLKPHTDTLEIRSVKLCRKTGGKSDRRNRLPAAARTFLLTVSDAVAKGKKEDAAGRAVAARLAAITEVKLDGHEVLADDEAAVRARVKGAIDGGAELVLVVGGTGLVRTDRTIEAIRPLLEREVPGIMEAARAHGQRRTPKAMLSRGIAGVSGGALVVTLPGSTRGAEESCDALFPAVLHALTLLRPLKGGA